MHQQCTWRNMTILSQGNAMNFLWASALLFLPLASSAVKYFTFGNLEAGEVNQSYATLASAPTESLPEAFTVCSSHKQDKLDGRGFYFITDEKNRPWMTFRWKLKFGKESFKIYFGDQAQTTLYIDNMEDEIVPNNWYHVCIASDIANGYISLAVNGKLQFDNMPLKDIPKRKGGLQDRLRIGIWYYHGQISPLEQFYGSVSNLQIHRGGPQTLENILKVAGHQQGDYLAWDNMKWNQIGKSIEENEIEHDKLCSPDTTYDIAIPEGQTQRDSVKTCQKLGNGNMVYATSQSKLAAFLEWFKKSVPEDVCRYIWTPFFDVANDGRFYSLDENKMATFLPWAESLSHEQRAIAIDVTLGPNPYVATVGNYLDCFACTIKTNFSARIFGACQSSFIGRHKAKIFLNLIGNFS